MQFFFVCGAPKSGTTWLQMMLDAHPEITCSGEGHFMLKFAAPVSKLIQQYNANLAHVAEVVYQGESTYKTVSEAETIEWTRSFIASRMLKRSNSQTKAVGDKTPGYTANLFDLNYLFPGCKVVNIVRDPRDVVVSTRFHGLRTGLKEALTPGSDDFNKLLNAAVENWLASIQRVDAFKNKNQIQLIEVRYEDLIVDPLPNLSALAAHLDVNRDKKVLQEVIDSTSFKAITGRDAGIPDQSSFYRKGIVGDWRMELDEVTLQHVLDRCGAEMRARGYV